MQHIHLDPVGGVAGDMVIAALLDAWPEQEAPVIRAAETVAGVSARLLRHDDGVLTGARFRVAKADHDHHAHADWRDIRARLHAASLPPAIRDHALAIFALLADAEARVHGCAPEEVTFHEVGAADSIADIVGAAVLIAAAGAGATWSVAALPLGAGRIETAHGTMPVPAPATALLLEGFETIDDGIAGERVTPTGAAILRHLCRAPAPSGPRRLRQSGIGFGTRRLPGISNCLRALVFERMSSHPATGHRELAVIAFEVDDQSAEDLAAGLDRVRALPGIHDVLQMPAFGKKGRMAAHVQVLARPDAIDAATDACFAETTTIGLRIQIVRGLALPRASTEVAISGHRLRVKLAERPGGRTGKAESDDVLRLAGHATRARLRRQAEQEAEQQAGETG